MTENKDFLGTEPVGKLLLRLALPTVTAQIINIFREKAPGRLPG